MKTRASLSTAFRAATSAAAALVALAGLLPRSAAALPQPGSIAPDFTLTGGVYADTLHLAALESQPVLLAFYDGGDMASIFALPYVNEWYRRYTGDGLKVIGIHSPALEPLKVKYNAVEVVGRERYAFPVGMDYDRAVYKSYSISSLPAYVLLKPGGQVVFETEAQRPYVEVEQAVQALLTELKPGIVKPFLTKPFRSSDDPKIKMLPATPETWLGYEGGAIEGCDSSRYDTFYNFSDDRGREKGKVYLQGYWKVGPNSVAYEQKYRSSDDHLRMIYSGKQVWLLRSFEYGTPRKVFIKQDKDYLARADWGRDVEGDELGKPFVYLQYSIPANIINNRTYGTHELELIPGEGDGAFYYLFFEGEPAR